MPIVNYRRQHPFSVAEDAPPPEPEVKGDAPSPSWGQVFGAKMRHDNEFGSALSSELNGVDNSPEEGYTAWPEIKGDPRYEPHWESFVDSRNPRFTAAVKRQIDLELEDKKTLHNAPWWQELVVGVPAAVLSPTILLPGGAFVRGARGGISALRSAGSIGAAAGAGTATQEAFLQAGQETRDWSESAQNIGASILVGGILGFGGSSLLNRGEWRTAVDAVERDMLAPVPPATSPISIGAAAVGPHSLDQLDIAGRAGGGVAAASQKLNPGLRLMHSENPQTRETAMNLFEMSQYIRGNEDGLATPIAAETLRKEWDAGLSRAVYDTREAYREYRKGGGAMSRTEFHEAVGKAMRRSDLDPIPEVQRAAQAWRSGVFDPLKEAAIAAKLLPEDVAVETAASYLSRLWNRQRLVAEEGEFKRVVTDWVMNRTPHRQKAFDDETARGAAKLEGDKLREYETERRLEREAMFGDDPREAARTVANEVFDKLTGRTAPQTGTRPEFITVGARGPLKGRTFNIPDELVERWLDSDVEQVGRRYQRIVSADVELANKFGRPDMQDTIQSIRDSYDKLRSGLSDERQLTKLAKAEASDIRDIEAVRDIIRGSYAQSGWHSDFGTAVRIANSVQYILKMGSIVLSSLTEPVRVVAAKGLTPMLRSGFAAFNNLDAVKLSVKEAQLAGNVHDKVLAHRLYTMADLGDFYSSRGTMEKFMDNMTNIASNWNGIRLWTDGVKMLASTLIQNQILEGVTKGATKKTARYLAYLGIDESMAGRIAKQFAEHGETVDGVRVAGTEKWTDDVAKRAYRAALNKDLDSMVVTRGAADLPLFANTPLGRLLFQFNTFNLASHQRILLRGLQEDQARFLSSIVALSSMGMLQTYLGAASANRLDKLPSMSENPGWWIAEGLDRSGVFAVPFQIANGVEKLTGINPIKAPLKQLDEGRAQSERMRNRNELGAVLGPSAGTIQDLGAVAGIPQKLAAGDDVSQAQKNAAERLLPFNSYFGVRQMLKYIINPPQD